MTIKEFTRGQCVVVSPTKMCPWFLTKEAYNKFVGKPLSEAEHLDELVFSDIDSDMSDRHAAIVIFKDRIRVEFMEYKHNIGSTSECMYYTTDTVPSIEELETIEFVKE